MAENHRVRGTIKFIVWTLLSIGMIYFTWHSYDSGQMIEWYYYQSKSDGYAINADRFKDATKEKPVVLEIAKVGEITGLQAVPVKKGDRLPKGCNGVITKKDLEEGKRVALVGETIKVSIPTQVKEAKGFKYKDTFKHKGVMTNQWSGAWNVTVVILLGLCLGLMAEGFTDMLGFKLKKIKHYEAAH
jgi:hypothetical protein